jgi:hypothetical protein
MRQLARVALGVLCIVGCSTVPFQEVDRVSVDQNDPEKVREQFSLALPIEFRIITTVTFQMKGQSFSALGYTEVDASKETFTVVGLHPAGGMKLFELSGDSERVLCTFALEEFNQRGNFAQAVGEDTRRMYLDRTPAVGAKISKQKDQILFRQRASGGEIEYVFAGSGGVLVEKRYYEGGKKIWSVAYYEYRREKGKLYPAGIILRHHEYGYQLIVRLKEILS